MVSFLSTPKPFVGVALKNQVNAIQSWLNINDNVEVILYGNSEGADKISRLLNIRHVPDIETNEFGTPLFNAVINHATQYAKYDLQTYVNCDILLTKKFLEVAKLISFQQFMVIGQRLDLADGCFIDINTKDWYKKLIELMQIKQVSLHPPAGSDYFLFRRGLWKDLPPIIIGRGPFDTVFITLCLKLKIPVIDATFSIAAIHQFHDYGHLKGGDQEMRYGIEGSRNRRLCPYPVSTIDATWQLRKGKLYRTFGRGDWLRALETYVRLTLDRGIYADGIHFLRRIVHRLGISKPHIISLLEVIESFGIGDNK